MRVPVDEPEEGHTFGEAIDLHVSLRDVIKQDKSAYKYLRLHLGEVPLEGLDLDVIRQYVEDRHENSAPNSIERDMKRVRAIAYLAANRGLVDEALIKKNLANIMDVVADYDDERMVWLSQEMRDKVIAEVYSINRQSGVIVDTLMMSGLRVSECMRLEPIDLTEAGFRVWTRKGKTRKRKYRYVPIHPKLAVVLTHWEPVHPRGFLFDCAENTVRNHLNLACARLGIKDFRVHDCRHTYAAQLRLAGADLDEIAKLLGHSMATMTARYAGILPERLKRFAEQI